MKKLSMRLKFCLNLELNWLFVIFEGCLPCLTRKIVDKIEEVEELKVNPRTRMWKQVIKENDKEDKRSEIEDLIEKTDRIEELVGKKLQEVDKSC